LAKEGGCPGHVHLGASARAGGKGGSLPRAAYTLARPASLCPGGAEKVVERRLARFPRRHQTEIGVRRQTEVRGQGMGADFSEWLRSGALANGAVKGIVLPGGENRVLSGAACT